jgi:hypothetical protein
VHSVSELAGRRPAHGDRRADLSDADRHPAFVRQADARQDERLRSGRHRGTGLHAGHHPAVARRRLRLGARPRWSSWSVCNWSRRGCRCGRGPFGGSSSPSSPCSCATQRCWPKPCGPSGPPTRRVHQAIRSQGVGDLSKVAAVVLETDGSLNVIPQAQAGNLSALPFAHGSEHPPVTGPRPVTGVHAASGRHDVTSSTASSRSSRTRR